MFGCRRRRPTASRSCCTTCGAPDPRLTFAWRGKFYSVKTACPGSRRWLPEPSAVSWQMFRLQNERGGAPAGTVSGGRQRARRPIIDGPLSDPGKPTNPGRGIASLSGEENEDYAKLASVHRRQTMTHKTQLPDALQTRHHTSEP